MTGMPFEVSDKLSEPVRRMAKKGTDLFAGPLRGGV